MGNLLVVALFLAALSLAAALVLWPPPSDAGDEGGEYLEEWSEE